MGKAWILGTVITVFGALFLLFVPVIYVYIAPACPVLQCGDGNFPEYGSVTYWAFHVGGVWMTKGYYAFFF